MKLIIVTTEYPPSQVANATRPSLLGREMVSRGHTVDIITRDSLDESTADSRMETGTAGERIHRIPDSMRKWRKHFQRNRLVTMFLDRFWPDHQMPWVVAAAAHIRKIEGNATVVALINPASMLLLRWLIPYNRFRLVYDYLESVTPFRRQFPHHHALHRALAGLFSKFEKWTLSRSDGVTFTCRNNQVVYIDTGLCKPENSTYLPQYCDPNPYAASDLPCDDKMVISHVGYFNSERSPEIFLRALRMFLDAEPSAVAQIAVNLYGNGLGLHSHLSDELNLGSVVHSLGMLDYDKTQAVNAQSHILLLVTSPEHNLFFPSKVAEYLSARRPILALLPENPELSEALIQSKRAEWLCRHDDIEAVVSCLKSMWNSFQADRLGKILPICEAANTTYYTSIWEDLLEKVSSSRDIGNISAVAT